MPLPQEKDSILIDPAEPSPESGDAPQGDNVQKRIDQITGQKHEATRRAEAAEQSNQALTNQLMSLQSTVEGLTNKLNVAPASAPVANDPISQLLGNAASPSASAPAQQPLDIASLIKSAVGEALSPVMQEQQAQADQQALFAAQQQSYQVAAQDYLPKALEQGSTEQQTFDAIFNGSQALQLDPNGPGIALAAVAGILGVNPGQQKQTEARKQAASSPAPSNALARLADLPSGQMQNADAIKALGEQGASQGLTTDNLAALIGLKTGKAQVSKE